ncbi:hypothetical protein [Desulfoferula mesophila]|uniref:Uncharacterized protein n=1 Tax=Desulfoferula mesophila TaxID=3058419 RepID=A0AAU9ED78_9BACT|nr:hypothetical protein FAK_15630 [Desulfoferula mesophilus]
MTTSDRVKKLPERVRADTPWGTLRLLSLGVAPDKRTRLAKTIDGYESMLIESFGPLNEAQKVVLAGARPLVGLVFGFLADPGKAALPPDKFQWAWDRVFLRVPSQLASLATTGTKAPSLDEVLAGLQSAKPEDEDATDPD